MFLLGMNKIEDVDYRRSRTLLTPKRDGGRNDAVEGFVTLLSDNNPSLSVD